MKYFTERVVVSVIIPLLNGKRTSSERWVRSFEPEDFAERMAKLVAQAGKVRAFLQEMMPTYAAQTMHGAEALEQCLISKSEGN